MTRIHFTAEDLARVRMTATLGLTAETVFALETFGARAGHSSFGNWHSHVRGQLGERLSRVEQLITENPPIPGLLWMLSSSRACVVPGADEGCHVRAIVSDFARIAVEPYWKQIRFRLEAERELRARVAITKGFDGLLSTLHPALNWKFPILEVQGIFTDDLYLGGNGVLLVPSLFLTKKCVIIGIEKVSGLPAIVFPASRTSVVELPHAANPQRNTFALGALIGHSRAAALEVLADGCSTGELSRQLGLSLAGASRHATVLRKAGLVSTLRHRNTALHVVTPLGQALLRGAEI